MLPQKHFTLLVKTRMFNSFQKRLLCKSHLIYMENQGLRRETSEMTLGPRPCIYQ